MIRETYFKVMDPPDAPPDTLWGGTLTISEAVSVNDTLYFRARHPFALVDALRADAEGRVWARVQDRDALLFDGVLTWQQLVFMLKGVVLISIRYRKPYMQLVVDKLTC